MCGIVGYVGVDAIEMQDRIAAMVDKIAHRGPDGRGTLIIQSETGRALFGHTRLSVIDTSQTGLQPMSSSFPGAKNSVSITFNGEIYNYRKLRDELKKLGHIFKGQSDTEVILNSYLEWGEDSFRRLRGMFSFALADPQNNKIFLVRDQSGIKPLYFLKTLSGGFCFSSEIRAFKTLDHAQFSWRLRRDAIHSFLSQGMIIGNETIVHGITELDPGTVLELDFLGNFKKKTIALDYNSSVFSNKTDRDSCVQEISRTLDEAVEQHLVSDVPLGLFLSSGIDSTALAVLCSNKLDKLHTISIGFDIPELDETKEATQIAFELGTEHQNIILESSSIPSSISKVLNAMDQPTVDGFNTFIVSKAAREAGLKVALSGLGGDEIFGGYASFRDVGRAKKFYRFAKAFGFGRIIQKINKILKKRSFWKIGRISEYPDTLLGMYFLRRELFAPLDRLEILGKSNLEIDPITGLKCDFLGQIEQEIYKLDTENAVSFLEQKIYMKNMLLRDSDVFSMANGIEIRVPFLDRDLVNLVNSMPGNWKRPGKYSKELLVDAIGKDFPQWVRRRKKRGFTFPWDKWIRGSLETFSKERLLSNVWEKMGIPKKCIEGAWKRYINSDPAISALNILALIILADYVDRNKLLP